MKCITGEPLTRLDSGKLRTAPAIHSAPSRLQAETKTINDKQREIQKYKDTCNNEIIETCFLGCTNDQDCQGNQICEANGRCIAGEMHKLLVTTVLVEPCFLGCTNDQDCQGNRICGINGRCLPGEMHKVLVTTVLVEP